jgi:hypothetical protein
MGLSSYKGEEVSKSDVTVAKNYLNRARRRQQVYLRDW